MAKTLLLNYVLLSCCLLQIALIVVVQRVKSARFPRVLWRSAWIQATVVAALASADFIYGWLTAHALPRSVVHAKAGLGMVLLMGFLAWYILLLRQLKAGRWP